MSLKGSSDGRRGPQILAVAFKQELVETQQRITLGLSQQ